MFRNPRDVGLDINYYIDWLAKRKEARAKAKDRPVFITISREFGCEGFEIVEHLINRINESATTPWRHFTRRMIDEALTDSKLSAEKISSLSEQRISYKDWFIDALAPDALRSPSSKLFAGMSQMILKLVDSGNVVILGSGAQLITRSLKPDKFHGLHFRVVADFAWRAKRMAAAYGMTTKEAEKYVRAREGRRERFVADFTGSSASDLRLYDFVLNNAKINAAQSAELIFAYLGSTLPKL